MMAPQASLWRVPRRLVPSSPLPEKGVEGELSTGCPCANSRQSERAAAADWFCRTSSASVHSECIIRASFVHPIALYASVAFRRA